MEQTKVQRLLDRIAISTSGLCMLHCLATPLLIITVPAISLTFMVDEEFHKALVIFVLPVSFIALFLGCRRHKDRIVILFGSIGLISLISIAFLGHDLFGEMGEKIATVISSLILVAGHVRNYLLCRYDGCDV